jgi:hypothetical protein
LSPIAIEVTPDETELTPTAIDWLVLAVELWPMATESVPLAVVPWPTAVAPAALAVEVCPTAVELLPVAVDVSPTAVALSAFTGGAAVVLVVEFTPHSVDLDPAPATQSTVVPAFAAVAIARLDEPAATNSNIFIFDDMKFSWGWGYAGEQAGCEGLSADPSSRGSMSIFARTAAASAPNLS